jgi:hypothetical protein
LRSAQPSRGSIGRLDLDNDVNRRHGFCSKHLYFIERKRRPRFAGAFFVLWMRGQDLNL